MKFNLKKALLALIIAPMAGVFMANSPYPEPKSIEYTDFALEVVSATDGTNQCTYVFNVTNTGEFYASARALQYENKLHYWDTYEDETYIFDDHNRDLIAPGNSHKYRCVLNGYRTADIDETLFQAVGKGYNDVVEDATIEYKGIKYSNPRYTISFDLNFNKGQYQYFFAFTIEYKGQTYTFNKHYPSKGLNEIALNPKETLDIDEVTVTKTSVLRGKEQDFTGLGVAIVSIFIGILVVGLIALIAPGVVVGVVFLITHLVKRHKNGEDDDLDMTDGINGGLE